MRRFVLLVVLLASGLALAQTDSLDREDLSRGLTLPPTTSALVEEATAPALNPAALVHLGGPQLLYMHERNIATNRVSDGLYMGTSFFHYVGAGLSLEWLRSNTGIDYRKTAWTLSLGTQVISVGVSLNLFNAKEDATLDGMSTTSVGISARPWKFLAFAASIRNIEAPRLGSIYLPREYRFGVATRPLGEKYSLGVDYVFGDAPNQYGRLSYVLQAEVWRGVVIGAGISHGTTNYGQPLQFQVSATLNTAHFGLTYAFGGAPGGFDHVVMARASMAPYRHIELPGGKVALFDLDDLLGTPKNPALAFLGLGNQEDPLFRTLRLFEQAGKDPTLRGVVLKIQRLSDVGFGKAYELREAVLKLRASGKKVVAVILVADDPEYFIASAADRVLSVPQAFLAINGLSAHALFLGEAMNKLGVHWDVAKVGKFKSAPDMLTRDSLDPNEREALGTFLDAQTRAYETGVARSRGLQSQELRNALSFGLVSPEKAVELGLVDEVVDSETLEKRLGELMPGARFEPGYLPKAQRPEQWGFPRKIAVIPVLGLISGGKSRDDPFGIQRIAGAETVVSALNKASADPTVDAIVLRIDSGGGDGLASDQMYRAVLRAKKKKPVIASMGDLAASGGYYAAMGAQEVWASPTTLTGSIGVFVLKPALEELANKLGIHQEALLRSPQADVLSLYKAWTPEEQKMAEAWAESFYQRFIEEVAKSRKMDVKEVDALAQGRIWSGEDAAGHRLVDHLGGWDDALAAARKAAHISDGELYELQVMGEPQSFLSSLVHDQGVSVDLFPPPPPSPATVVLQALGLSPLMLVEPGVKAVLPYQVNVR